MRQVYTSYTELRNSLDNAMCAVKPTRRRPPSGYEVEAPSGLMIQRFLRQADPKAALLRLSQADAPFVTGDPTEMPRPQARKTSYVGTLKDGTTRGFWLLLLATPYLDNVRFAASQARRRLEAIRLRGGSPRRGCRWGHQPPEGACAL